MKVFLLREKRCIAIYGKLSGILGEAAVGLLTVKRWYQHSKADNFSLDDENRRG
jgi:hypothetical protein